MGFLFVFICFCFFSGSGWQNFILPHKLSWWSHHIWLLCSGIMANFRMGNRRGYLGGSYHTWRIIPVSKWLVTPIYKPSHLGHLEGEQPYLGDLLNMVINHLLTGMVLQVTHRIHGTGIFAFISLIFFMVNVGKYTIRGYTWILWVKVSG